MGARGDEGRVERAHHPRCCGLGRGDSSAAEEGGLVAVAAG